MSVGLTVDWQAFNKSAEALLEHTSRTYPEFANGQMLRVSLKAIELTKASDKTTIENIKNAPWWNRFVALEAKKAGYAKSIRRGRKNKFGSVYTESESGGGALGSKSYKSFLAGLGRKIIAARKRATYFIRSGWIYSVQELLPHVKGGARYSRKDTAKMTGKKKGGAKPATPKLTGLVECEIWNSALIEVSNRHPDRHSNPMPVATAGLQKAVDWVAQNMAEHLAEKLQPIFDKPH